MYYVVVERKANIKQRSISNLSPSIIYSLQPKKNHTRVCINTYRSEPEHLRGRCPSWNWNAGNDASPPGHRRRRRPAAHGHCRFGTSWPATTPKPTPKQQHHWGRSACGWSNDGRARICFVRISWYRTYLLIYFIMLC